MSRRLTDQIGRDGAWRARGLTIGSSDFSVAAVMPPAFTVPAADIDVWVRADAVPEVQLFSSEDQRRLHLLGRLAPGVTVEQAAEDVRRVAREIDGQEETRRQPRSLLYSAAGRRRSERPPRLRTPRSSIRRNALAAAGMPFAVHWSSARSR